MYHNKKFALKLILILIGSLCIQALTTEKRGNITLTYGSYDLKVPQANLIAYVETFFMVCPAILAEWNPNGQTNWSLLINNGGNNGAQKYQNGLLIGGNYSKQWPAWVDTVTWGVGMIIILDSYPPLLNKAGPLVKPLWITDNLLDYNRYLLGVNNDGVGWNLGEYDARIQPSYMMGGKPTARFFVWLENHFPGIMATVHRAIANFDYTVYFWKIFTNQTIDELWQTYAKNPKIFRPPRYLNGTKSESNKKLASAPASTLISSNFTSTTKMPSSKASPIPSFSNLLITFIFHSILLFFYN